IAIKSFNNIVGPNSLVLTLLVFSAYPRITYKLPLLSTTLARGATIKKAIRVLRKASTTRQVRDTLNTRNRPSIDNVLSLPL
ncbi:hypothetical protein BU23DRAFT_475613, partial [Bimuria novae-zelandiae CBS 107.79]